ncbi:hypothetical protein FGKAn22_04760 [Ferrigenium kumadai]|uniref:Flagellar hook-length control protein-like C-terminal domain-containing protein n=1 Tax=Ferrigenium kumadai TaxID=1682490 RepID=A0AAN1SXM6_9PROT|nr:flagellar hook-length control protein FliK [Ferrigenium kumadai]BBI98783.1 hypothetical protein FGKAn22_04760 [Ferrigenium kumadai]
MLPANLISALRVLSRSDKPLVAGATDAPAAIAKVELGQKLQASVQSEIGQGIFKVQIAGQSIQMRLPENIKSGDVLELEVIATQPRITFRMAASTNPLSTPEQIGGTARLLSNLTERPLERPVVQQLGSKAVWPAEQQVPDTKQLAGALREALANSGLFYESHQAQWVRGERSTAQLLVEPQNQLTGKQSILTEPNQPSPQEPTTTQSSQPTKVSGDTGLPIAKELLPLVQQQLHTLETHQLTWIGQVWPGQEMQWEIQGQPEHQAPRQQSEREWSTEMELALPRLGDVHARLVFAESGLRMTLHAADAGTIELFNRALPQLRNALADAGIPLTSALVEKP